MDNKAFFQHQEQAIIQKKKDKPKTFMQVIDAPPPIFLINALSY